MKRFIFAATAALAVAACADSGPLLENKAEPASPVLDIVWGPTDSIFTTQTPNETGYAAPGWQVGTEFTAEDTMLITGFRFYKASGETGTHTAKLYPRGDSLNVLASASFTSETSSGWQRKTLGSTVQIPPGNYVVAVNTNTYQAKYGGYFSLNGSINRTDLTATGGRYGQPINKYPQSGSSSAFFVDVLYRSKLCNDEVDFPCP
jgi:Domain of unknown function (DUF4082)/Prokaryotic membrane lipoprotein lipid attachment site